MEDRRSPSLSDADYQRLLEFRSGLRRFLHWSEEQAHAAGVTPAQHQLMLAVRGHADPHGPSIGELAEHLVVRHHSAVGLVDRTEAAGFVTRVPDPDHHGTVRVRLTTHGRATLEALSAPHLEELSRMAPAIELLWRSLTDEESQAGEVSEPAPDSGSDSDSDSDSDSLEDSPLG